MSLSEVQAYVERVRDANPLLDVVEADARVVRRGGLYWSSPLRQEKDPSFAIYPDQNSWFDYGTREGGDVFDYIQLRDNCTFWEAVRKLAQKAGIETWGDGARDEDGQPFDPKYQRELDLMVERRRIGRILADACEYMCSHLTSRANTDLVHYLEHHYGITRSTVDKLMIGWCDNTLYDYLHGERKYSEEHILETGLFFRRRSKQPVCIHEDRLVFPYWADGRPVYTISRRIEGRTPDDDFQKAKYKKQLVHNERHPYVSEYVSNEWLWGHDSAKRKSEFGIITEGVTDAISTSQIGLPVLSPVTVRFKDNDIPRLVEATANWGFPVVVNDHETPRPDPKDPNRMIQPGLDGAKKTCVELIKAGQPARLLVLPKPEGSDKIDLNEYLRDHKKDDLVALIHDTKPYVLWLIEQISPDQEPTAVEEAIGPVCELLAYMSELQRDLYIGVLCKRFGLGKRAVKTLVGKYERARKTELLAQEDEEDLDRAARPAQRERDSDPQAAASNDDRASHAGANGAELRESEPTKDKANGKAISAGVNGANGHNGHNGANGHGGTNGHGPVGPKPFELLKMHGEIFESKKRFYYQGKGKLKSRLSNFVIVPRARIETDRGQRTLGDVLMADGRRFDGRILPENTFHSARDFNRVLQTVSHDLAWSGVNANVAALVDMLSEFDVPTFTGVPAIGLYETADEGNLWIGPHGVINKDGFTETSRYTYDPPVRPMLARRVNYEGARLSIATAAQLAQPVVTDLFKLNAPEVILPLIGWYTASLVSPYLRRKLKHFPSLWMWGTGGSGKTSLHSDIFWPMFSGVTCEPFSCSDTPFAQIINASSTNAVANVTDEYKSDLPLANRERIQRLARKSYTMEVEQRGRPDRTMDNYLLSAPQVFIGEMIPEDAALRERLIVVSPMKTSITPDRQMCMKRLVEQPLHLLSGSLIRFLLGCDLDDMLAGARALLGSMIDTRLLSPRISDNLLCIVFGDLLFDRWCMHLGLSIEDRPQLRHSLSKLVATITSDDEEEENPKPTLRPRGHVRDMLDHFISELAVLAHIGEIEEGVHYCGVMGERGMPGKRIYIYTDAARIAYLEKQRRTGQSDETLSSAAVKRAAREKSQDPESWLVERSRQVSLRNGRPRCIGIDVAKLDEQLGVSFPVRKWRHGHDDAADDYDLN